MIEVTKKIIRFILQDRNKISTNSENWPLSWKTIEYKTYRRIIGTPLFANEIEEREDFKHLTALIKRRRSSRDFSSDEMDTEEIIKLLSLSVGTIDAQNKNRSYPSGGQLYPVETYYINIRPTKDLKISHGVYHFSPLENSLSKIKTFSKEAELTSLVGSSYPFLNQASGCIVCTLTPRRNAPKYGWLGLRLGLIEIGSIVQNIYLASTSLNIKCCAIAGFNPEITDELLDIDGLNELSVIIIAVGK